jgi:hypothetical protein
MWYHNSTFSGALISWEEKNSCSGALISPRIRNVCGLRYIIIGLVQIGKK